ncbi:MAG: MlaE family lipid ABC transporter permease subunit [Polyangiaceae bacterium]|nr:MlaE family lipid ABC transporter permease subunit [Polyangiaceae bacterium]
MASNALRSDPLALHAFGDERAEKPSFDLERRPEVIVLRGRLAISDAGKLWRRLETLTSGASGRLDIDVAGVAELDGSIVSILTEWRTALSERGVACEIIGARGAALELLRLYGGLDTPAPRKQDEPDGFFSSIGRAAADVLDEARDIVSFVGEGTAATFRALRTPRMVNRSAIIPLIERAGADAIPIVLLLNFLVGFVMGFQSARQLETYGATIFVADIVGLSVTRELAPLMTAIIVCGRTGAAFTAELATMKVSEEIDALRAMGFSPMAYLVFPRLLSLLIVVPALTVLGNAVGVLGGMVVATMTLGIGPMAYLNEIRDSVHAWDVLSGIIKSFVYAGAIGLVACQRGLSTSGGAEGVGRSTTRTVVTCLFFLVVIDALMTVIFRLVKG